MKAFVVALYSFIGLALFVPWAWAGDMVVGSFAPGKARGWNISLTWKSKAWSQSFSTPVIQASASPWHTCSGGKS